DRVCSASAVGYDAATKTYSASIPATCIGDPSSLYFDGARIRIDDTGPLSDSAPDADAAGALVPGRLSGYWMVGSDGKVYPFGEAVKAGEPAAADPVVDLEPTPAGDGYWIVDEKGHINAYNAPSFDNVDLSKI